MSQKLQQKPRLGNPHQPTPSRWAYVEAARKHKATKASHNLSDAEVQHLRAMYRSGAVPFTIAAHFSVPRRDIKKMSEAPFKLRADVPRPFETPAQTEDRIRWLKEEINNAHGEAIAIQVARDWTEAKKENRRRARVASRPEVT